MGGLGQVKFGRFWILWLEPNTICYQNFFLTQPNLPSPKNQVGFDGLTAYPTKTWLTVDRAIGSFYM